MNSPSSLVSVALALGIASAPKAAAVESREPAPLQLKPNTVIAAAAPSRNCPFVRAASPGPELDLLPRNALRQESSLSSCDPGGALCYNRASGHIDFRPARNLMPDLYGLTRETISLNRHGIIFRYSF